MTHASARPTDVAAQQVVTLITSLPGIVGVSLGGSAAAGLADDTSDLDLHVYWRGDLAPPAERAARLAQFADAGSVEVNILTWGLEDHARVGGRLIELIYVHLDDLRAEIDRAYSEGLITEGYTTARLYYLAGGRLLHDTAGKLTGLRDRLLAEYPESTRKLLLQHQPELLRYFLWHLRQAQQRGDLLFVQHRRYALQSMFYNLLFALNRRYHPGEKRLLIHGERCARRPAQLSARWAESTRLAADDPALPALFDGLIEELCALIEANR
jgi:hypothetical protein